MLRLVAIRAASVYAGALMWDFLDGGLELRVEDDAGSTTTVNLNANFLRDRCSSSECVDLDSYQPLHDVHFQPTELSLQGIEQVPEDLNKVIVTFSDGVKSEYALSRLAGEVVEGRCSFTQRGDEESLHGVVKYPAIHVWNATLVTPPVFHYDYPHSISGAKMDLSGEKIYGNRDQLVATLLSAGIALMVDVPKEEGFCTRFGNVISTVRPTEWGKEFNVRTMPDLSDVVKKDLAYTPLAIGMHTDNPYRDPMPDFQMLHQIEGCECEMGVDFCEDCHVENLFVDGFFVAMKLRREDPEAFRILTEIPVRWENNGGDGQAQMIVNAPHIELETGDENNAPCNFPDGGGICIKGLRFSSKSGGYAPLITPKSRSDAFFAARRKFSSMLAAENYRIKIAMRPGQMVIFDNRRVLHSRSYIHSPKKARYVQGCYINRDGLFYTYTRSKNNEPRWTALDNADKKAFDRMGEAYGEHVDSQISSIFLNLFETQKGRRLGQPVDLYEHGIQAASRALRGGEDADVVVMSLFHDLTESLASKNHGVAAAALMEPYLSPKVTWMLQKHEIFQGHYYFHHFGMDRNIRDKLYKDHEFFEDTVRWCEQYDQRSFDPSYPSFPLTHFKSYIDEVFSRKPFWWDPENPMANVVSKTRETTIQCDDCGLNATL